MFLAKEKVPQTRFNGDEDSDEEAKDPEILHDSGLRDDVVTDSKGDNEMPSSSSHYEDDESRDGEYDDFPIAVTNQGAFRRVSITLFSWAKEQEGKTYPADSYSFMALYSPFEAPFFFFFGFIVFSFQVSFLFFIVTSQVAIEFTNDSDNDNPSDSWVASFLPSNVTTLVRATQIVSILSYCFFVDSSMKDCIVAVEQFPRFDVATQNDRAWLKAISCVLRFSQGFLAFFASLLLIVTNADAVEIILNFTAVNYISALDDLAFSLAKEGKYGNSLKREAEMLENEPIPDCMHRKYQHLRYILVMIPITLLLVISTGFVIYGQENSQMWVTQMMRVQFQDSYLQPFSGCYEINSLHIKDKRKTYDGLSSNGALGTIGYCKSDRRWILYVYEEEDENEPTEDRACNIPRERRLANSATTDAFDVSSSFDESWYSASGTPLDLYFFESDDNGKDLRPHCTSYLSNGVCDVIFNTVDYQYDGGDCCAATCTASICGFRGITKAFGVDYNTGNGYPNCSDPELVPLTIHLNSMISSRDKSRLSVSDDLLEDYARETGVDFWEETPVRPLVVLDCDGYNVLSIYVDDSMLNQTETVMVSDGAFCRISVSNVTNDILDWSNDPIWWVDYTVYDGDNTTFPMISGFSGTEESIEFQRIPICYFDKLLSTINISSVYNATDTNTQALNWLINDESKFSRCTDHFLIERFALSAVNFAAPINAGSDGSSDAHLWISVEQHQCLWDNIVCKDGTVDLLKVRSKDLIGTIPTAIRLLTGLRHIMYDDNGLVGTIPSEIGLLTKLTELDIDTNVLTGTIPSEIGKLVEMIILDFDKNELTGTIPSEFGYLTNGEDFDFSSNKLSGPIPTEIGRLDNMERLYFVGNQLTGTIPTEIGKMARLERLEIPLNAIIGGLPRELFNMNLTDLIVFQNLMTGSIPSEIGLLSRLEKLSLHDNELTGTLPSEIGLMTSLRNLNLRRNNFSGTIPSQIGFLTNLKELWLDGNNFSGTIPLEISVGLKGLRFLALDDDISGTDTIRGDIKTLDQCILCDGAKYELRNESNNDNVVYTEKAQFGRVDSYSCRDLLQMKWEMTELMSADGCQVLRECILCGSGGYYDLLEIDSKEDNDKATDQLNVTKLGVR